MPRTRFRRTGTGTCNTEGQGRRVWLQASLREPSTSVRKARKMRLHISALSPGAAACVGINRDQARSSEGPAELAGASGPQRSGKSVQGKKGEVSGVPRLEAADEEAGGSCLESGVSYVIGWESASGFLQLLLNWKPGQNQGSHQLPVKS